MLPPENERNPLGGFTIPRYVRSRVREHQERQICAIVVRDDGAAAMLIPETAELLIGPDEIVGRLSRKTEVPWAVATDDAGRLYQFLEQHGPMAADYKARGSIREARAYQKQGGLSVSSRVYATFTDFGWGKRARAIVLDPAAFSDLPAREVLEEPEHEPDVSRTMMRLCLWAGDVLYWCRDAGVNLRPGRGGIASQFLTDARFWPPRRRKVPRRLNAVARDELPGNYYRMFSSDVHPTAVELDQKSAHHNIAARVPFTDADTLHGYGTTGTRATLDAGLLCGVDDSRYQELRAMRGVFWVRVNVARRAIGCKVPLPQLAAEGPAVLTVWSSEFSDLEQEPGVDIVGIVGAIVSRTTSDALNKYAAFALEQLHTNAENRRRLRWLKPLLLAVYGTMAQSPKPYVSFSTDATAASTEELVILGNELVSVHVARSERAQEPRYVNVLDRGIIEAETRAETVRVARAIEQETEAGERAELVALYADSVLIAPDAARGGVMAGDGDEHAAWAAAELRRARAAGAGEWRSSTLTDLEMLAVNAYRSSEVTKRPGVARSERGGLDSRDNPTRGGP